MTIKSFLHFTINELRLRFTHLCPVQFEEQVYGIGLCSIPPAVIVKNYELVLSLRIRMGMGICDSLAVHMVTKTNQVDLLRVTTTNIQTHKFHNLSVSCFWGCFSFGFPPIYVLFMYIFGFWTTKTVVEMSVLFVQVSQAGFFLDKKEKYTLLFIYLANLDSCTSLVVVRLMIHVSVLPSIFRYSAIF